ncbi:MAG: hypothetical protein EPO35_12000 [Acidobacteria bacterium]|nr:MAG: hypothetical protein EPO35_12000 [Acidobacteriota bacterium]
MTVERTAVERRILASLDAGRIPVLLGGCGIGRTTLLQRLAALRPSASRYIDLGAVATTPERCLVAVTGRPLAAGTTARAAFDQVLREFDRAVSPSGERATVLLDAFQELRTFENFPGLRDVQRDFVAHLAASPNHFVLASRFTARAHRLLRDAPARFEVIHLPPLDGADVEALARARDGRADWARQVAPAVQALSAGRAAYAVALVDAMAGAATAEAGTALAELFSPAGRLTALARFSYEFRLHRARGYGALKAILGILAEEEPLTLTDIAHRLHRTPGSTKDYLSWLEDVDVLNVHRKKYSYDDPLVRLYVRLYTGVEPPSHDRIVAETRRFAAERLSAPQPAAAPDAPTRTPSAQPALAAPEPASRKNGIIEID